MTSQDIIQKYISFFEKRGHKRIPNASLVPENDPTTLFTSSGMQPLVPYLLGEPHPQGKRLVNVQNCFRAQDIEEVGDNRHTTFFRMLGNWSLGDYFKKEQLPWFFEFLTKDLGLPANKLYVTVFEGFNDIPRDDESANIWKKIFENEGLDPQERIFYYGTDKNWWSRAGEPKNMPIGEPGGPDSEVFYKFDIDHDDRFGKTCHPNCNCGRFLEIGNSVFMEYQKQQDGSFKKLPQKNVDFGGGLERLLAAIESQQDIFQTNLFSPIIKSIEKTTKKFYVEYKQQMRIITDHLISASFIISAGIYPSNKEQGYVLRRLIRRGLDNHYQISGSDLFPILETIINQYKETDKYLVNKSEEIKNTILEEEKVYKSAVKRGYPKLNKGVTTLQESISRIEKLRSNYEKTGSFIPLGKDAAKIAFDLFQSYGIPIDIFLQKFYENFPIVLEWGMKDIIREKFGELVQDHATMSKSASSGMFRGGLADHSEITIMGHTATHLMHQAIRDVLGNQVHQTGSNITTERIRFDFNYDKKLTDEEIKKVEDIVNQKIKENLKVHFEMMSLKKAKETGAIGLFDEKYSDMVKVYFINGYSVEFCGGPHVDFTSKLNCFKIIKQENIGKGQRRLYSIVG